MCLRAGSKDIKCGDAANATIKATTTSAHVDWRVSLEGTGMFTPTVELTVTFPAVKPSVKITHARFDGTGHPDTNGVQVIFVPARRGQRTGRRELGHAPATPTRSTRPTSRAGTDATTLDDQGPATNLDKTFPVTAKRHLEGHPPQHRRRAPGRPT